MGEWEGPHGLPRQARGGSQESGEQLGGCSSTVRNTAIIHTLHMSDTSHLCSNLGLVQTSPVRRAHSGTEI